MPIYGQFLGCRDDQHWALFFDNASFSGSLCLSLPSSNFYSSLSNQNCGRSQNPTAGKPGIIKLGWLAWAISHLNWAFMSEMAVSFLGVFGKKQVFSHLWMSFEIHPSPRVRETFSFRPQQSGRILSKIRSGFPEKKTLVDFAFPFLFFTHVGKRGKALSLSILSWVSGFVLRSSISSIVCKQLYPIPFDTFTPLPNDASLSPCV